MEDQLVRAQPQQVSKVNEIENAHQPGARVGGRRQDESGVPVAERMDRDQPGMRSGWMEEDRVWEAVG